MRRKLFITGVVASITFLVTVFVAYPKGIFTASPPTNVVAGQTSPRNAASKTLENQRTLALQPEALKLSQRIGAARFKSSKAAALVVQGMLKTDGNTQPVTIIRRQTEDGERVEVALGGNHASLSWARDSGPQGLGGKLDETERVLLERLTYDSADQFILAQLRGASYSLVIRNLRPDDAGDDYTGPLWDVVRVDDPEPDEQKRPLSAWRLYYINRTTGLIDKVVSDVLGERIEAQLSDWTERNGERSPAMITWSRGGQTLMTFNLINVSSVSH
jgi:hypothetical protein